MKDKAYDWYPITKTAWEQQKEGNTYTKECLYKHASSRYNDKQGVSTPAPVCSMYAATTSRPASARMHCAQYPVNNNIQQSTSGNVRGNNITKKKTTTRRSAWSSILGATTIPVPPYASNGRENPFMSIDGIPIRPRPPVIEHRQYGQRAGSAAGHHPTRPQSAAARFAYPASSHSLSMASPSNRPIGVQLASFHPDQHEQEHIACPVTPPSSPISSTSSSPASSAHTYPYYWRPTTPVPPTEQGEEPMPERFGGFDYDEQLEKYGWRFEVPGDPLGLKKPCLTTRQGYTTKVSVPTVAPYPPTVHLVGCDTYFYNTIPCKSSTFTIHNEFISEALSTKRMALQKRDQGTNYNYKQYAFIY